MSVNPEEKKCKEECKEYCEKQSDFMKSISGEQQSSDGKEIIDCNEICEGEKKCAQAGGKESTKKGRRRGSYRKKTKKKSTKKGRRRGSYRKKTKKKSTNKGRRRGSYRKKTKKKSTKKGRRRGVVNLRNLQKRNQNV
jgi:hypothetical protein